MRIVRRWMMAALLALPIAFALASKPPGAVAAGVCSNETIRIQQNATHLPDCRAYELVTPADSNGRLVLGVSDLAFANPVLMFRTENITPAGDSVAFATFNGPVGELGATGAVDVFGTQREEHGWTITRRFSPRGDESIQPIPGGISADHLYTFIWALKPFAGIPGGSLATEGPGAYLGKPDGTFELIGLGNVGGAPVTERIAQGRYIAPDGAHVIFSTGNLKTGSLICSQLIGHCPVHRLADNAPTEGTGAVYDRSANGLAEVISLLPGDVIPAAGEDAAYQGVSKDGATVAFKIGTALYVRVPDATDGTTLKAADGNPVFAGLSDNGRYLFYVAGGEKGTIHRYDTSDQSDEALNPTATGEVVNISADGSRVYFISEEQIGGHGTTGQPNLHVWSGASTDFIATVAPSDLVQTSNESEVGSQNGYPALTNWTDWAVGSNMEGAERGPGADSSRSTPDGEVLVFESRAKLAAYNNGGHTEIYRFDDADDSLICVSCNDLSAATGEARLQRVNFVRPPDLIHNVSDDGNRVFFESTEALIAADMDEVTDVYEWRADVATNESLKLISSGRSRVEMPATQPIQARPNVLYGVTPSGSDVLFLSQDELVLGAGSGGTPSLYDARIDGGFPTPQLPTPCAEESCKPLRGPSMPSHAGPPSEALSGVGNVKRHKKNRCRQLSKRHRKHRCSEHRSRSGRARASSNDFTSATSGSAQPAYLQDMHSTPVGEEEGASTLGGTLPAAAAGGEFGDFGFKSVSAELTTAVAGLHPDFKTNLVLTHQIEGGKPVASARAEEVSVTLPPGLLGSVTAVPQCRTDEFIAFNECPVESQLGVAKAVVVEQGTILEPVYNLEPPHPNREVARLGFIAGIFPVFIDVKVQTAGDYAVVATVRHSPGQASLVSADTTLWGDPSNPVNDPLRLKPNESALCSNSGFACGQPEGKREVARTGLAFMSNPSACQAGEVGFSVTSYQLPGQVFEKSAPLPDITDCAGLPFAPSFSAEPTSHTAGAATGLKTKLVLPQHLMADERSTATMREARVTLPEGMQIAAGAANWIGVCSDEQVGYHREVDAACPDSAKLGAATIASPALSAPIEGAIYQRSPSPGRQFGLWLAADALGLHIKLPGSLEPDKQTGRLTAVFRDLPQVPVEEIDLEVWGGDRAPLQNPDRCGAYTTDFSFSPHSSDPAASGRAQMQITEGCGQGFSPSLKAGVTEPAAGKFSPFVFDLTRPDGDQALRGFDLKLPDGELAKIKGVALCGDAEASAGSCPAASRIGSLAATAGPGPEPLAIPQPGRPQPQIYLSGPYQGAPFSILTEVPAQAGPFDLGVLAVRSGLEVEPETGRAVVKADPLPQFFEGVGIAYRRLHAVIDRPEFSLNPTDCREMAVGSDATSTKGAVAHPSARFQLDGCKRLGFKPKLSLKLKGGTKRADYPALTAVLKARKGDANIAFASVALPHSEFLAQEHIGTICTRRQFAADKCPKGSVYGRAEAVTPLLDKPLSGPVYLRSSDHPLPDLVAKLGGQLEIDLVGRIDSKHGGIRTTFESVPDAPVSRFVLQMRGGVKGLLTNSTDICRGARRATVQMKAQNGRRVSLRPALQSGGCGNKKLGRHHKHH
jgi:hypothetical protein